jgi:hypothetical protein
MSIFFRVIDRDTGFLVPPSVDEWLPDGHLARFVVEAVNAPHAAGERSPSLKSGPAPSGTAIFQVRYAK